MNSVQKIYKNILLYFITYIRLFYIKIFTIKCPRCNVNFFFVYFSIITNFCANCKQEFCKFCVQPIVNSEIHNNQKCFYRYTILYFMGLTGILILYLKFILSNSNILTKFLVVLLFLLEYLIFNEKVDNFINTVIITKNIIVACTLVFYYEEKDIMIYIMIGVLQLVCIMAINGLKDYLKTKISFKMLNL